MNILGIETSCDETAAAVVKDGENILSNAVASSARMHARFGGIIPEQAARQQIKSIISAIEKSLKEAFPKNTTPPAKKIDAIAVTVGPGLIGSLLVGVETAKTLSVLWEKPIISVNHLVGHIYANWLRTGDVPGNKTPDFPALCLLVSGGHTDLVLMKNHGKIKWIGGTRDDAAGEAFDKCARLLGLTYPGGPSIAKAAAKYNLQDIKHPIHLPRPMITGDNFEWSFSGLKTAVLREVKKSKKQVRFDKNFVSSLSFEIQEAICDVLTSKTIRAIQTFKPKSLLLAGGVAANTRLRQKFQSEIQKNNLKIEFFVPLANFCTDNAAYIASCAYFNRNFTNWERVSANPGLTISGQD
jgi:N6-L-threonylcarbamoyladenine synthase